MGITCAEKFESRRLTTGEDARLELVYSVAGTEDEQEAIRSVLATSPGTYGSQEDPPHLFRQSVAIEPVGQDLWLARVNYDRRYEQ